MTKKLFTIIFVSYLLYFAGAQDETRKCASHEYEQHLQDKFNSQSQNLDFERSIKEYLRLKSNSKVGDYPVVKIPVVVHVLHNNQPYGVKQNVTDATIRSQIAILNQDYRKKNSDTVKTLAIFKDISEDTRIEFCLAEVDPFCNPTNGIIRIPNAKSSYNMSSDFDLKELKRISNWPSDKYLNIWVANLENNYLGLSTFPFGSELPGIDESDPNNIDPLLDGVVLSYKAFGNQGAELSKKYNRGRTATHEIGHWLGLRHIWGDGQCGEDYCDDTPFQNSATTDCSRSIACYSSTDYAMNENFMDYTIDSCMNMFSHDQVDRMRACLSKSPRRSMLVSNNNCSAIPDVNYRPDSETFENDELKPFLEFSPGFVWSKPGAFGKPGSCFEFSITDSAMLLQTKTMTFKKYNIHNLTIDLKAIRNSPNFGGGDTLILSYSRGCMDEWKPVSKEPIKFVENVWFGKTISLASLDAEYVRLKLDYKGGNNTIWLDNIRFSESALQNLKFYYSNESNESNELVLDPYFIGLKDFELKIYTTNGDLVFERYWEEVISDKVSIKNVLVKNQMYIARAVIDGKFYIIRFADLF